MYFDKRNFNEKHHKGHGLMSQRRKEAYTEPQHYVGTPFAGSRFFFFFLAIFPSSLLCCDHRGDSDTCVKLLTLENHRGGKALLVRSNVATDSCASQ